MLNEWIGRHERAQDEVSLGTMRRVAALLDSPVELRRGDAVPERWYIALFTPTAPQSSLGPDGHPAKGLFLPPVPLPRRMFAGRRVSFHEALRIGDEVERVSTIKSISPKQGRSGEMCFVTVRHEISGPRGLAVVEEQDIVYRGEGKGAAREDSPAAAENAEWSRKVTPDASMIFRYSAITFNAHRIHYDTAYTRDIEGYPDLIVNGGLTTLLLWELAAASTGKRIHSSTSRNLRPLFVNRPITLCATPHRLWALDSEGHKALEAQVELA
jgi:3-methylfumaryl-CoA hydratase